MESRYALVLTTVGSDEEASLVARALVDKRLAACVNILPPMRSVYRWKGEIYEGEERLLLIKTTASHFSEIRSTIRAIHSYELPEVVLVPIVDGDPAYLEWIEESVRSEDQRST